VLNLYRNLEKQQYQKNGHNYTKETSYFVRYMLPRPLNKMDEVTKICSNSQFPRLSEGS
jgi:hypothetical protein